MRVDVIGAGPAGLAVAWGLTQRAPDAEVHVWERKPLVGTTPCGEGLRADRLGMIPGFDLSPYVARRLQGAWVDVPGPARFTLREPCVTLQREKWLPAWAEAAERAGATFHLDAFLTEAEIRNLPGDVVAGADGPASRTARIVGNQRQFVAGVQARVEGLPDDPDNLGFVWDPAVSTDYAWVFPREDMTLVGLLGPAGPDAWRTVQALCDRYHADGRWRLRESAPIPYAGTIVRKGRYALVGDAAGTANPLTKGGIAAGILHAHLLVDALAPAGGGLDAFEAACRRHPLFAPDSVRAAQALRRLRPQDIARVHGRRDGSEVDLGRRTVRARMLARFAAASLRRPTLLREAWLLSRGMPHAVAWGW